MTITGIPYGAMSQIADDLGFELAFGQSGRSLRLRPKKDGSFKEIYRQIGQGGRRVSAVNELGFFVYFKALFEKYPDAVISTFRATYRGEQDFLDQVGWMAGDARLGAE